MKLIASGVAICAGNHEIALVLAVLVVDEDEHAPVAGLLDDLLDRRRITSSGSFGSRSARARPQQWRRQATPASMAGPRLWPGPGPGSWALGGHADASARRAT
jgi:hypothetical protein